MTVLSPRTLKEEGIFRHAPLILTCLKKDAAASAAAADDDNGDDND